MRANSNLVLSSDTVVLVPYRQEHVARYHSWMEDAELREATASERLSLEEEYDMQRKWAEDADKCTFIVLDPASPDTEGTGCHGGGMAGDVNLFFNDPDGDMSTAEIEVMVAEKSSRRRGLAAAALQLLMAYASLDLGVRRYQAKIGETNAASLALFQRRLDFVEVSRSSVFQEVTLERTMDRVAAQEMWTAHPDWQRGQYDQITS